MTGRMVGKPLRYCRHVLLEVTGRGEIESACTGGAAVLEIVRRAAWNEHEGAFGCVYPFAVDKKAHGAVNNEENVVFGVGVSARALGVWFQPPLGDRVLVRCFSAISFEYCGDAPHRIGATFARTQDQYATAGCGRRTIHERFRIIRRWTRRLETGALNNALQSVVGLYKGAVVMDVSYRIKCLCSGVPLLGTGASASCISREFM